MCLGVPAKVIEIREGASATALVDIGGVRREVDVSCVVDPEQGTEALLDRWVLVHVGFAMSVIDEEEAERTLSILQELGEVQEALEDIRQTEQMLGGQA
ncbi:HypC/HybG/HupF family hydrogenase formation chaperone [Alcanivorax sp.]|uniref:HypC/HybG/HupF family hydrogenase formation chaperone n=1 Tax=Alcanivorax sp. TaxID=1872427 RepID=UPI00258F1920|nr:HypC/HybG/HupF family hydrogenase formation chaperone [Alcanivorax sp.]